MNEALPTMRVRGERRRGRTSALPCAHRQRGGAFLIEALVALVVFSIGAAGLLGMMAKALRDSGNARWRTEASYLADSALSQMAAENSGDLQARYGTPDSPGYRRILAAASELPGVSAEVNAPSISIEPAVDGSHRVVVTVHWQLPADVRVHRASASSVFR